MARTAKNYTYFSATVNGVNYEFKCWAGTGCHRCEDQDGRRSVYTYYNRPWESFRYESVLSRAIEKQPKGVQDALTAAIIDKTRQEEKDRADAMFSSFASLHSSLNDENKKRLADSGIMIESEEQAGAVMGLMGIMALMQG